MAMSTIHVAVKLTTQKLHLWQSVSRAYAESDSGAGGDLSIRKEARPAPDYGDEPSVKPCISIILRTLWSAHRDVRRGWDVPHAPISQMDAVATACHRLTSDSDPSMTLCACLERSRFYAYQVVGSRRNLRSLDSEQ